jgi:hypothetical protein
VGLLQLVAVLAFAGAILTMAIPGPATEITGVATILALGSLALLAGHTWGAVVIAAADVVLAAKLWPLVLLTSPPSITASIALGLTLPGLVLFAVTLPNIVEATFGSAAARLGRLRELGFATAASAYLLLPVIL